MLWQAWWQEELHHPDRHDYYMMRVALEVARKFAKDPNAIKLDDFLVVFTQRKVEQVTEWTQAELSKATWLGALGVPLEQQ